MDVDIIIAQNDTKRYKNIAIARYFCNILRTRAYVEMTKNDTLHILD